MLGSHSFTCNNNNNNCIVLYWLKIIITITDLYSTFGSEDTGAQYRFLAVPPLGQTGKQRHNVPSCPLFRPSFHSFKFVTATL